MKLSNFQDTPPLVYLRPTLFHSLVLGSPILPPPPPPLLSNKLWKNNRTVQCERTKSKQKQNQVTSHSNWPRFLLFDLAFSPQTMQWYGCIMLSCILLRTRLVMSRTCRFRVNPHSIFVWTSRNSLLETGGKSGV